MKRTQVILINILLALSVTVLADVAIAVQKDSTQAIKKISYAIGFKTGQAFRANNLELNVESFSAGLDDGLHNRHPKWKVAELKKILAEYHQESNKRLRQNMRNIATKNQQLGAAFLAANKKRKGVRVTKSGLQYKIITKGKGKSPTANNTVVVEYEGKTIDGKTFDKTRPGSPAEFPVEAVIPGWQEALQMMRPGATWEIYIPPKLGYGLRGVPGSIGPNETLIFKVKLIAIKKN